MYPKLTSVNCWDFSITPLTLSPILYTLSETRSEVRSNKQTHRPSITITTPHEIINSPVYPLKSNELSLIQCSSHVDSGPKIASERTSQSVWVICGSATAPTTISKQFGSLSGFLLAVMEMKRRFHHRDTSALVAFRKRTETSYHFQLTTPQVC